MALFGDLRFVLALAAVVSCQRPTPTRVRNGEVEVRRVTAEAATRRTAGTARAAVRGDWILRDHDLHVSVAGTEAPLRNERPGTITQVIHRSFPEVETVRTIEPFLRVGEREATFSDVRFEAAMVAATPLLRLRAKARVGEATLDVDREYFLEPGRHALHVRTRVANASPRAVEAVVWGVRLEWEAGAAFAPGLGTLTRPREGTVPWVGHAVGGIAMAWTLPQGRGDLTLRSTEEMHESVVVSRHVEAVTHPRRIPGGGTVDDRALLLIEPGDLTAVARAAALVRAEPLVETTVLLRGEGRAPVITVTNANDAPVLMAEPTERVANLALSPGTYTARVTAPGHAPSDPVRFEIARGATGAVPIELQIPPGALIRVEAIDGDTGRDLPVRVTVRGVAPTLDPMLGPPHTAAGAGLVAITARGRTEIPVPPGRYRVTVSHGPEWSLVEQETTVTETLRGDVSARLQHIIPMESWIGCDLHVHASPSYDSRVSIEDRVASLLAEGVQFATPTEHNVVGDYQAGIAVLPETLGEGLQWVPAVEVTTDRSAQPWGHFNVYPYHPDPQSPGGSPPPFLNTTPRQIFRAARANNPDAIIQVNHPRMQPNIGYFSVTGLNPQTNRAVSPAYDPSYDAIEVFNGFYINRIDQVEAVLTDWMSLLGTGARYIATGSSDSHQILFQWAGYPRTYVHVGENRDPSAILASLRQGHAFVTSGPMLFFEANGVGPGDTVAIRPQETVRFHLRVLAAGWMPVDRVELFRDGQRVVNLAVRPSRDTARLDTEVALAMSPGSFVVAVARGPRGGLNPALPYSEGQPFAFTNPIFFVEQREGEGGGDAGAGTTPRGR
jgi:hypothetical protein